MIDRIKELIRNHTIEYDFVIIGQYNQKYLVHDLFFKNGEIFIESKYERDHGTEINDLNKFSDIFIKSLYKELLNKKKISLIWID